MPDHHRPVSSFTVAPTVSGLLVMLISMAGFTGWLLQSESLMSVGAGFVSMKPNTAIGLFFLGVSTLLLALARQRKSIYTTVRVLSLLVAGLGMVTLLEYLFSFDIGIDQLLFDELPNAPGTWSPGRMAAITCFAFVCSGLALHAVAAGFRGLRRLPDLLSLGSGFAALFVLLGYLYDTESLRNMGMYGGMAVHTAAGFLLLALAFPFFRPEDNLLSPLFSKRPAGAMMRWILPSVILGPIAVGLLRQFGEQQGYFSYGEGVALGVVTTILFLVLLTLFAAHGVDRTDRAVTRAENVVQRFFDLSNNLLCIANMDGYFVRLNLAWERSLGFSIEELTQRPFQDFLHPDDLESTIHEYNRQAAGCDVISFENRYRCKDGSYRTLLWNATPPADNGLIYASAHDISGRKQSEQQIAELNRALSTRAVALEATNAELEAFSYSVSHDLRAPLRSIDGFSQALLEDYYEQLDESGRDFLARVRASTQRMGQLIDDMLQLSRVTRSSFHREPVDLSRFARSIVDSLREKHLGRDVEVEIAESLPANCDSRLIHIALENLFDNAWKYTSRQKKAVIRFETVDNDGTTAYCVKDNGVGFDSTYVGKLFNAFQRLHGQEEFEGTGIGLATVKRIIARHGGTVWAEGNLGKGAAFYFTLTPETPEGDHYVRKSDPIGRGQFGRRPVDAPCP